MSQEKIILRSAIGGLWARLITQLLAYWLGFYWLAIMMSALVPNLTIWGIAVLLGLAIVGYFSFKLIKDHPLTWPKEVEFNFVDGYITLLDGYGKKYADDILDAPERKIPFSEIEHLHAESYESIILSSVYRLSVVRAGQKMKLVALKSPNDFTYLIGLFKGVGIRVR